MHEGITVFVEEGDWYVQYQTCCKNLRADNHCGIYETRPEICREYQAQSCDYQGGDYGYDHLFTHPKQIEAYYREKKGIQLGAPKQEDPARRAKKRNKKKTA